MSLASLEHLAGTGTSFGGDPAATWAEYRWILTDAIANDDRTLQTRIGPSGVGTPCPRCLAHKLAGTPERRGEDWLPYIGRAVHTTNAEAFLRFNANRPGQPVRFLTELGVDVGEIDGQTITGSLDLYDTATAEVTDWKIVGAATLTKAKATGVPVEYGIQGHLYGRGAVRRGLPVRLIRVAFLPRNEPTLDRAVIITEPYNEGIAVAALERATALTQVAAAVGGWDQLIPSLPALDGCQSCHRYPNLDGSFPASASWSAKMDPFADLIGGKP